MPDRDLVAELIHARRGPQRGQPPSADRPLGVAEAYGLQDRLRDALVAGGERVAGWKVGFTGKTAQEMFGHFEPVSGFLLASGVFTTGAEVVEGALPALELIDFRFGGKPSGTDLIAVRATYTRLGGVSARFV
jgi:2-keto-4-pentenoate hydratase